MTPSRRTVLSALFAVVALVAAAIVADVLATAFFAVTVASVLVPLHRWLEHRGLSDWWASTAATAVAFLGVLALFAPVGVVLYLRRRPLSALLASHPDRVTVDLAGFTYALDASEVAVVAGEYLTRTAVGLVRAAPVIAAKAAVFGFVVFALLFRGGRVRRAAFATLPERYHGIARSIHRRIRGTLFALYVIQAATALGTFAVAAVVFFALGYRFPIALAVIAGVLQFLPVVGPSLVVVGVAAVEASTGAYASAAVVLVLGLVLIGVLPDAVLRPRLARRTADLPASLYFVGFTGGLLSLGAVGIIAGPLVVAVLIEVLALLADEMHPAPAA